jgi:hypothetical protein
VSTGVHVIAEFGIGIEGDDAETLRLHADALMQALLDLEECDSNLTDSAVGIDTNAMIVTIELGSVADVWEDAVNLALASIRTAIHVAGGSTPRWLPFPDHPENPVEYTDRGMNLQPA